MSEVPFWAIPLTSVLLTLMIGACCLPAVIRVYRFETGLATWSFPKEVRDERREGFERQLEMFLESDRRQMYRPEQSAVRLFGRMLVALVPDLIEAVGALTHVGRLTLLMLEASLAGFAAGAVYAGDRAGRVAAALEGRPAAVDRDDLLFAVELVMGIVWVRRTD